MLSPKQKVATKSLSRRSESYQYSKIKSATVRGVSEKKLRETAITKTNWGQNTFGEAWYLTGRRSLPVGGFAPNL